MRIAWIFLVLTAAPLIEAQERPKGISVSTWVREDLFAGYLDGDMTRHAVGLKKLDAILAADPKSPDALAWRAASTLFAAVLSMEAGDAANFEKFYTEARSAFAAAALTAQTPQVRQAVLAVTGGGYAVFGDRLPAKYRKDAWLAVRENYSALKQMQMPVFDKLPVHFRGELLAGLAQAAQRLGEAENAKMLTQEITSLMPGTPYAVFAKRWLDKPEMMATAKLTCVSCHDAGRLQTVRAKN